jgi:copper homeostasis protein
MVFELCAENLAACQAAQAGGAHRVELCASLEVGGLTPAAGLVAEAVRVGPPVHAMVRPRPGDFDYSGSEFATMLDTLDRLRRLGIAGAVVGILTPDGRVDIPRMSRFVEHAGSLEVSFHRAFDEAADLDAALEAVIAAGCIRLLTSGGAADVLTGAARLRQFNAQAAGRIAIAAGGGLRLDNAAEVARISGLQNFHGTLRRPGHSVPEAEDIRSAIRLLSLE